MSDTDRFVYEVARDLGWTSKALREAVEGWALGWDVSHHMRRLDAEQQAEIARRLGGGGPDPVDSSPAGPTPEAAALAATQTPAHAEPPHKAATPGNGAVPFETANEARAAAALAAQVADDDGWAGTSAHADAPALTEALDEVVAKARRKAERAEQRAHEALQAAEAAAAKAAEFLARHKSKKAAEASLLARKYKKKAKKRFAKAKAFAQQAVEAAHQLLVGGPK